MQDLAVMVDAGDAPGALTVWMTFNTRMYVVINRLPVFPSKGRLVFAACRYRNGRHCRD